MPDSQLSKSGLQSRRRRDQTQEIVPAGERRWRTDLGLAILAATRVPGKSYSCDEIALYCGCTDSAIRRIEQQALKKIRVAAMRLSSGETAFLREMKR